VIETAILADQDDDMLDRAFGGCVAVVIVMTVVMVVIVAIVLTAVVVRVVFTLVPAAPASFSTITGASNCQRRHDTQRGRDTPSISQIE
jgi:hypothetical protein